jgi:hypothetical protein
MRRKAAILTASLVLSSMNLFMGAPAKASCQTNPDVGDICVLTDEVKETLCANKIYRLTGRCG